VVKLYGALLEAAKGRYSPAQRVGARRQSVIGKLKEDVGTI
jgi:hypothetical protein